MPSRSNIAIAEISDPLPASKVARLLRIPADFIRERCQFANLAGPHSSLTFKPVDYFDTEAIRLWMENEPIAVANGGGRFDGALALWKSAQKEKQAAPALTYTNVMVKWQVWCGDRSQTKTTERVFRGCTVRDTGGKFVTIILPDGQTVRKGRDTIGFEVYRPDGLHRVELRYNRLEAKAYAFMTPAEKSAWMRLQGTSDDTVTRHLKRQFCAKLEMRLHLPSGSLDRSDLGCPAWQATELFSKAP